MSFGNFLIKQLAVELRREFAGLSTFITLSPAPGLRAWARAETARGGLADRHRTAVERLETGAADPLVTEIAARYLVAHGRRAAARSTRWRAFTSATARVSSASMRGPTPARAAARGHGVSW